MEEDFKKLESINFSGILRRLTAKIYCAFSSYDINYVSAGGKSNTVIINVNERIVRTDHNLYLKSLSILLNNKIDLVCVNRRINIFGLSFEKRKIENDVNTLYKNYLAKYKKIVIFCPHTLAGYLIQESAIRSGVITACLQHGYYRFKEPDWQIYSKVTRTDFAFIFSEKDSFFFSNCRKVIDCGEYFRPPTKRVEVSRNIEVVYLTLIDRHSINRVVNFLESLPERKYVIRHHPRTGKLIKLKLFLRIYRIQEIDFATGSIGCVNHFFETTAWKSIVSTSPVSNRYYEITDCGKINSTICSYDLPQEKITSALNQFIAL